MTHSGTIAGNGFFNHLLLSTDPRVELPLLPTSNGLIHALSQPAWETCDTNSDEIRNLHEPIWTSLQSEVNRRMVSPEQFPVYLARNLSVRRRLRIPKADLGFYEECVATNGAAVNSAVPDQTAVTHHPDAGDQGDLVGTVPRRKPPAAERLASSRARWTARSVRFLEGSSSPKRAARFAARNLRRLFVSFLWSTKWDVERRLKRRRIITLLSGRGSGDRAPLLFRAPWFHISLGAIQAPPPAQQRKFMSHVLIEHGTIRWSADPPLDSADSQARKAYAEQCRNADHIWVTNLDTRTLELVEEYAPDRWSVLPHPYVLDPNAPYDEDVRLRANLLSDTDSEFLVLSASSMSLTGDQNKGTGKLVEAMTVLRRDFGLPIGFLMVEWGTDIDRVKRLCAESGVIENIAFVKPMSRIRMQKTMAACDVLADQFHYEAFGALSIRAWEQGMAVVSRRVSHDARPLMGEIPPVSDASTSEEIARAISDLFRRQLEVGRTAYKEQHLRASRGWLVRRHHHGITRQLQLDRYQQMLGRTPTAANPGAWGAMGDWDE